MTMGARVLAVTPLFLTLVSSVAAYAEEFQGRVVGITDGDTIKVMQSGAAVTVRLADIDCPEKKQSFGSRAKQYCSDLAFGKDVTVSCDKTDKYKRLVGSVRLPSGQVLNQELVRAGFAWCYVKYCKDPQIAVLEQNARHQRLGLWQDPNPVAPWEWRKSSRKPKQADFSVLNLLRRQ